MSGREEFQEAVATLADAVGAVQRTMSAIIAHQARENDAQMKQADEEFSNAAKTVAELAQMLSQAASTAKAILPIMTPVSSSEPPSTP